MDPSCGDTTQLFDARDWSQTALGPLEGWPKSLLHYVRLVLATPSPTVLLWGPEQIQIYNDAYAAILGSRHPRCFGEPSRGSCVHPEPLIQRSLHQVLARGVAVVVDRSPLTVTRDGVDQEAFFTHSFAPLRDDRGELAGVQQVLTDVTDAVLSERRAAALCALDPQISSSDPVADAVQALAAHTGDIPFAILYAWDPASQQLRPRASTEGMADLNLTALTLRAAEVYRSGTTALVEDLAELLGEGNVGPCLEPTSTAVLHCLGAVRGGGARGLVVFGTSPRLRLDHGYRRFLQLCAGQLDKAMLHEQLVRRIEPAPEPPAHLEAAVETSPTELAACRRRERHLALLADLSEDFSRLTDAEAIMQIIGSKLGEHLRVTSLSLCDVDELHETIRVSYGWGRPGVPSLLRTFRTPEYLGAEFSRASRAGETVVVRDTRHDPRCHAQAYAALHVRAFVTVPFRVGGEWKSFLAIGDDSARDWQPDELELIHELANRLFPRLERARAEAALHESEAERGVERTRGELALRAASNRLRLIADSVPIHLLQLDRDERIRFVNQAAAEMWQRPIHELVGKTIAEVVGEAAQQSLRPYTERVLRGESVSYESAFEAPDGSVRTFLNTYTPDRDEQGAVRGFVATGTEITDRKRAEEALDDARRRAEMAEARFRTLLESVPHIVWKVNPDGQAEFFSRQYSAYTGLSTEEGGLGMQYEKVVHPVDMEVTLQVLREARQDRASFALRQRIRRADGEYRWHQARGEPVFGASGEFVGWIGTTTEIHEQKLAEEQLEYARRELHEFFTQTPIPMALLGGPEHRYALVNPKFVELAGRNPLGKTVREAFVNDGSEHYVRQLDRVYRTGAPYIGTELSLRTSGDDGRVTERLFNVYCYPFRGSDDAIEGVLTYLQDVTDMVAARQRIEQVVLTLERERELRERFVATLSHDLRSPLATARLSAQLLLQRGTDPDIFHKATARIVRNMDRADHMLKDLLDVSRIEAGKRLPLELGFCELRNLVESTLEELTSVHGDRFVLSGPEAVEGYWSSHGLRRILENLCTNAIKYGAPETPVSVSIQQGSGRVHLRVHNFGPPIPPSEQEDLFEPFRRTTSARAGGQKGWGLGLTLVRGVAEAHGGEVTLESGDAGTVFTVTLPYDARPLAEQRG